jgi:hypothetical protein
MAGAGIAEARWSLFLIRVGADVGEPSLTGWAYQAECRNRYAKSDASGA